MAKHDDEDPKPVDEDDEDEEASEDEPVAGDRAMVTAERAHEIELEASAEAQGDDAEADAAAAQLGTDRYVLAGFFAAGLLGAYVVGRTLNSLWESASNKDWFNQALPVLAAVGDEDKSQYCFILSGVVALIVVLRVYRRPDVRTWTNDVASELAKVVWPTKKEVYNSTFIVIVASAAATVYLALLDRLWAFVTNIVYGDGS